MSAKDIFEKLVNIAHGYSWHVMHAVAPSKRKYHGKPGELLNKLTPEEREELKNLTSEDVSNPDRNVFAYIEGAYPNETNVTVHSHPVKKDET